ncbi:MAG: alpha/beta hydrolase [Alphaproteobacteria bacterium]|nr:alpha/beta hydrolase [Alphaproteobacteria bacterium]
MKILRLYNNHTISYKQQYFYQDAPTILYVHGLMSDMSGFKANAIYEYAKERRLNYVAFDNLGHGNSSGNYLECNISTWLETLIQIIRGLNLRNSILVGSSMGGWISLLASQMQMEEISGLVLVAPAPDFTENIWAALSDVQKYAMMEQGYLLNLNDRYQITHQLLADGKKHLILSKNSIKLNIPVVIMHGMQDAQISYRTSLKLTELIESPWLCAKLAKNSTHRMGGSEDVKLLLNSIDEIIEKITNPEQD